MSRAPRRRDQRGNAIVEFSWLAMLLLVPLLYLLLGVFDVQRTAYGATAATHAAGRAFMLAAEDGEDVARARAYEAARIAMRDQGVELDPSQLEISCTPDCFQPDSTATVALSTQVALPLVPDFVGGQRPSVRVGATHTEPYGRYREGQR